MKAIFSSLFSLCAAIVCADGISLTKTESAAKLVDDIAKQTGLKMSAAPNVRDDVVILDCKGATLDDVMAQTAGVLHAEWTKSGDTYLLTRGANLVSMDERIEATARVAAFKARIDEMVAGIKTQGDITPEVAKKMVADHDAMMDSFTTGGKRSPDQMKNFEVQATQTPGSRAIIRLLNQFSNADLALLGTGHRVVFTNRPTRMQRALPGNATDVIRTFLREQAYMTAATPPPDTSKGQRTIMINGFGDSRPGLGDPNDPAIAMFVLNDRGGFTFNAQVSFSVADSKGLLIFSANLPIAPKTSQPTTTKTPDVEKPILLSDLAQELDKALSGPGGHGATMARKVVAFASDSGPSSPMMFTISPTNSPQIKVSPELRNAVLHPETTDPLSFSVAESLRSIAQTGGKSLCAYVPDTAVLPLARFFANGSRTPSTLRDYLIRQLGLGVKEEGAWLSVKPVSQVAAREQRVSRVGLGTILRTMDAKKSIGLSDVAAYAVAQPKAPSSTSFDLPYAQIINGAVTDEILTPLDFNDQWLAARFYGLLSHPQRTALLNGGGIPIGTLTPDQLATVTEQVFQGINGPGPLSNQPMNGLRMFGAPQGPLNERTFVLANGLPSNGIVRMKASNQPVLQATNADGSVRQMSPEQLAMEKYESEHPEFGAGFGASETAVPPNSFRPSSQTLYDLQFICGQNYGIERTLQDWSVGTGEFVSYDQLPADIRNQVDTRLNALRQGMKFSSGGPSRQAPPPRR